MLRQVFIPVPKMGTEDVALKPPFLQVSMHMIFEDLLASRRHLYRVLSNATICKHGWIRRLKPTPVHFCSLLSQNLCLFKSSIYKMLCELLSIRFEPNCFCDSCGDFLVRFLVGIEALLFVVSFSFPSIFFMHLLGAFAQQYSTRLGAMLLIAHRRHHLLSKELQGGIVFFPAQLFHKATSLHAQFRY